MRASGETSANHEAQATLFLVVFEFQCGTLSLTSSSDTAITRCATGFYLDTTYTPARCSESRSGDIDGRVGGLQGSGGASEVYGDGEHLNRAVMFIL